MNRAKHDAVPPTNLYLLGLAAMISDSEAGPEERGACRGAQRHDDGWAHHSELLFEPSVAGNYLGPVRRFVQPALAALLEFEVLDGIGQIDPFASDPAVKHCAIKQPAGRSDEWFALFVLNIAGRLAH